MCDKKSTYITSYLNYFCDIELSFNTKSVFSKIQTLKWKTDFSQTCINTKIRYLSSFEAQSAWIESNTHIKYISMFLTLNPK